jgi:hypothetical protein
MVAQLEDITYLPIERKDMIKKFIINSTKQNNLIKKDTITIH